MTLGCGGFGGNITSDNISPKHLLNIKRVAYELRPARSAGSTGSVPALPKGPAKAAPETIAADGLTSRIDRFLATRGLSSGAAQSDSARSDSGVAGGAPPPGHVFFGEK